MSSVVTRSSASRGGGGLSAEDRRVLTAVPLMPYNPPNPAAAVVVKCRYYIAGPPGRLCNQPCRNPVQKQLKRCKKHENELQTPNHEAVSAVLVAQERQIQAARGSVNLQQMIAAVSANRTEMAALLASVQGLGFASIADMDSGADLVLASVQRVITSGTGTGSSRRRPRSCLTGPGDEFDAEEAECRSVRAMRVEDDDDLAAACSSLHIAPEPPHRDDFTGYLGANSGGGDEMPVDIVY